MPKSDYRIACSLFILAGLGLASRLFSADAATEETKTHTLFMGADLAMERNNGIFPVVSVTGDSLVIKMDGQDVRVPLDGATVNLRIEHSLKLTEKFAAVTNLKGEMAYTPGNDPNRKLAQALVDAEGLNASRQSSVDGAAVLKARVDNAASNYQPDPLNPVANAAVSENIRVSTQNYNTALAGAGSTIEAVGVESEEPRFDAMDVTFEVSAEKPLNNPYVVVIARYREPNGKPGVFHNWIYARALRPINREPRKVHCTQGGFPPGFRLEDFQVHLYDRNEEVATSFSPKRVELNREDAFQYVLIEYIGAHKGATLPAVPAMGKLPADLAERLAGGEFSQPYYVKVSDNGQPGDLYLDESCTRKVGDPYLESVVKGLRFKPALANGHPVAGVARLKFNELAI